MKHILIVIFLSIGVFADCQTKLSSFVFMLGKDTIGFEQYRRSADKIEGDILILSPKTTNVHFTMKLSDKAVTHFESYSVYPPSAMRFQERDITIENDTTVHQILLRNGKVDSFFTRIFSARTGSVPYFDYDISMYEQMIRQGLQSGKDSIPVDRLSNASMHSYIKRTGNKGYQARLFNFPVFLTTDAENNITMYDATASTVKVMALAIPGFDFKRLTEKFLNEELQKGKMGNLSVSDTLRTSIKGSDFMLTYGRPLRRGRTVFGNIVPWSTVWRTGANFATHFTTSKELTFGSVILPPGRYTLWTLPDPAGSRLIINKGVNIFGTQYNPQMDLLRLDMKRSDLPEMIEQLTIALKETADGGKLVIQWERTEYSIDFKIAK